MPSLLADALGLVILAVGGVLTAVRVALWAALLLRGSEPPPAPRNVPLRRTSGDGNPPPPKNTRIRPRNDGDALRCYLALTGVTALMAFVLGGCGFLPPAVRTTHIETPTVSGENATASYTEVGGVVSSVRVRNPPNMMNECVRYFTDAFDRMRRAGMLSQPSQEHWWVAVQRQMQALNTPQMCLNYATNGVGMYGAGAFNSFGAVGGWGMGPFPGGLRFKVGGER